MSRLYTAYDNGYQVVDVRLLVGRPLGAALTQDTRVGTGVAGILRRLGAAQLASRFLVAGESSTEQLVCGTLSEIRRRSAHYDPAWITLVPDSGREDLIVFALTRAQVEAIDEWLPPIEVTLQNGQNVRTIDVTAEQWWGRRNTYELVPWTEPISDLEDYGPSTLQLQGSPSAPFAGRLGSSNSYFCVVNPTHKAMLGSGFAVVINPLLEKDYRGLVARFPVLLRYREEVTPDRIILDETIEVAIGLRPGEPLLVQRGPSGRTGRRHILSYRHTLCRAIPAATLDMEKPIVRIEPAVFDVLGVSAGSRLILEGIHEQANGRLTKVKVRGLEERGGRLPLTSGVPDVLDTIGSVDLPQIAMDLATRNALGISRGGAVYVRPALSSVIADEFTNLSLVLLAATVGSVASDHLLFAAILAAVYATLTVLYLLRRLR